MRLPSKCHQQHARCVEARAEHATKNSKRGAPQSRGRRRRQIPGYTHIGGDLYMDRDGIAVTFSPEFEDYSTHAYVGSMPGEGRKSGSSNSSDGGSKASSQAHDRGKSGFKFEDDWQQHRTQESSKSAGRRAELMLARLSMRERKEVALHLKALALQSLPLSRAELKSAYNAAAKRFHPDVAKSAEADSSRFHKATLAYQYLLKVLVKLKLA